MIDGIKRRFYWKGRSNDVENHCRGCPRCAERNSIGKKYRASLKLDNPGYLMERVAMEIIGPKPTSKKENRFILVVEDYFTKWPEAYATPTQEARVSYWVNGYRHLVLCGDCTRTKEEISRVMFSRKSLIFWR